jgi:hypothetical protein
VRAAVREAIRFPLAGEPLNRLAVRGGTATVVIEPPHLPVPSAAFDPRQEAVVAASRARGARRRAADRARRDRPPPAAPPREIGLLFRPSSGDASAGA